MTETSKATLGKRFLAIFYDCLIAFFFSFIIVLITQSILIMSEIVTLESVQISETETIQTIPAGSIINKLLLSLWLVIPFLYFGHHWTKNNQTLGMRVWKLNVISPSKDKVSWVQAALRYSFALFGLGYIWMLFDKENLPLQDRVSNTRIIRHT